MGFKRRYSCPPVSEPPSRPPSPAFPDPPRDWVMKTWKERVVSGRPPPYAQVQRRTNVEEGRAPLPLKAVSNIPISSLSLVLPHDFSDGAHPVDGGVQCGNSQKHPTNHPRQAEKSAEAAARRQGTERGRRLTGYRLMRKDFSPSVGCQG
jgi:hypothetical protein